MWNPQSEVFMTYYLNTTRHKFIHSNLTENYNIFKQLKEQGHEIFGKFVFQSNKHIWVPDFGFSRISNESTQKQELFRF